MTASPPLAALTGATGFLGVHLVRALAAEGFRVRALARREPSAPGWGEAAPEIVRGDLFDTDALDRLVAGASVVIHAAGAIKAADLAGFMAVNRDGSAHVAAAIRRAGSDAHLVAVSSLAAREPSISAYAASKRAGESAALEVLGQGRVTVARPPAIYGPGDRETLTLFRAALASPVLPVLSSRARVALVHVEDAAAQIAALAGRPTGGVHAQADGRPEGYAWREIFQAAGRAVGRRPIPTPLPAGLLPLVVGAAGFVARMNGRPSPVSADKLGELLHPDWAVDSAELDPNRPPPRFDIDSGFAHAVAWYRGAGWMR